MVIGPAAQRPVKLALRLLDGHVIDAGKTPLHESVGSEFPVFIAIGPEPVAGIIVPLVGVPDCDAMVSVQPELFDQPVI